MKYTSCTGVLAVSCAIFFGTTQLLSVPPGEQSKIVARGKYLAVDIGGCQDCHSPRDQKGQFITEKWMQGAELFFKPAAPIPSWTQVSPGIAGLPNWTDEQAITFLSTGVAPDGSAANPPMPQYRYNRQDARAVAAYLRSLKPGGQPLSHSSSKP